MPARASRGDLIAQRLGTNAVLSVEGEVSEQGAWTPAVALELARLLMAAISEAVAPFEDGELRIITSRGATAYFVVADPSRPGCCAGGWRDDAEGWRFFHGSYACAIEQLDVLEQVQLQVITPSPLVAFGAFLAPQ